MNMIFEYKYIYIYDTSQAVFFCPLTSTIWDMSRWHPKSPFRFVIWRRPSPTASRLEMVGGDFWGDWNQKSVVILGEFKVIAWLMNEVGLWSNGLTTTLHLFGSTVSLAFHFFLFGWCILMFFDEDQAKTTDVHRCLSEFCEALKGITLDMHEGTIMGLLGQTLCWTFEMDLTANPRFLSWWKTQRSVRYGGCIPWGCITLHDHFGWFWYILILMGCRFYG